MIEVHFLPAKGGDFLWVRWKQDNCWSNLLIDGGFSCCHRDYGAVMDFIIEARESVDAVVLTHIDDDHIKGFQKWLVNAPRLPEIRHVFFNTGRQINREFGIPFDDGWPEDTLAVEPTDGRYSVSSAIRILEALERRGLASKLSDRVIASPARIELGQGAALRFISPSIGALRRLAAEWDRSIDQDERASAGLYGAAPDPSSDLGALANEPFVPDRSSTNGASLAFLFEFEGKRLAFLGDAWADECVAGLNAAGWSEDRPCDVALVKMSHHGSPHNLSVPLARTLRSPCFLISTKPDAPIRPQKVSIARLLSMGNPITVVRNCRGEGLLTENDQINYVDTRLLRIENVGQGGKRRIEMEGGLAICGKTEAEFQLYRPGL